MFGINGSEGDMHLGEDGDEDDDNPLPGELLWLHHRLQRSDQNPNIRREEQSYFVVGR